MPPSFFPYYKGGARYVTVFGKSSTCLEGLRETRIEAQEKAAYPGRMQQVHVAAAFSLARHQRAVFGWGRPAGVDREQAVGYTDPLEK